MMTLVHNKNISLLANFQCAKDFILAQALKPKPNAVLGVGLVSVSISISTYLH